MTDTTAKTTIHHLFILDESGSMSSVRQQTIDAFNELMSHNTNLISENPDQEHRLSFITFNGCGVKTVCFNELLNEKRLLDYSKYNPDDNTPLWDAMGSSILRLKQEIWGKPLQHVLVTIFTDGMENASKEFSNKEIKLLVEDLKTKGWAFTYLGTEHDVHKAADSINFNKGARVSFNKECMEDAVFMMHSSRKEHASRVRQKIELNEGLMEVAEKALNEKKKNA
ncbi:MAG: VWA domain-containing protein [Bacteroidetes bacterium]|nr:VWA domain-containing protein [Bacteroidota bacterium]MBP7400706.1 VWA domain-containing protein [Chitinophagales bacterium]MBK7108298.1 VWA domain-containing protein [Bacteroidota bacterium]MBK8486278.1 VWA domain-containing protein [Bacteroidota bacterium]MBK8683061.1 VWA domain-containing protein [Bacteroidota bacterium]